jgi:O-antigen ligase
LFIVVPLILTPYNYELFEFNKMLAVYFLTIIIAAAWISKMILQKRIIFCRTPFDLPLLLFLASQIISTVLSIDPHTSVWGYYSRFNGGLMSTICYLTLYYAFVSNAVSVKNSLKVILSTAAIVSLYAIAEHFGIDKKIWVQDVQNRVFSTLGQPNWLAAYLVALVPLSGKLMPLFLLAIWFTKSLSGLGATAIILALLFIFFIIKQRFLKIILITVLLIGSSYYLLSSPLTANNQKTLQLINEENQTRAGGSSSLLIRRVVWQGAIDIFRHYPLFGSGVETFAYSYYNFRPASHNLLSEWDFLYNKAHNEFLNLLATTGAFGLASYLFFISAVLFFFLKNPSGLMLGFISILITNFFGFSVVPVALFFFMFPAFAVASVGRPAFALHENRDVSASKFSYSASQYFLIIIILIFSFYFLVFIFNMWRADYQFNLGRNYLKAYQLPAGLTLMQKAVALSPQEPLFQSEYAEGLAKLAYAYESTPTAQLAIAQSDLVIKANPVHLNYWKSRIKIFLLLTKLDQQYELQALDAIQQAIVLAPTDAKLYYNLGLIYNQLGQKELAKQALQTALELKPNYDIKIPQ